ncbi:hypothetical protein HanIR_Chr09g0444051 [Helianthus annuus]|nr:hypothetical protein HanIR_Chr09g0444051 [Helianthus annuus]
MLSVIHVQFFNLGQNSEFDFEVSMLSVIHVQSFNLYIVLPVSKKIKKKKIELKKAN